MPPHSACCYTHQLILRRLPTPNSLTYQMSTPSAASHHLHREARTRDVMCLLSTGKALEAGLREKRMVTTGTQCGKQALTSTGSNHQRRSRRSLSDVGVTGSRCCQVCTARHVTGCCLSDNIAGSDLWPQCSAGSAQPKKELGTSSFRRCFNRSFTPECTQQINIIGQIMKL